MVNYSIFNNVRTSLNSIHLDDGVFKNNRLRMTQPKLESKNHYNLRNINTNDGSLTTQKTHVDDQHSRTISSN